MVSDNDFRGIRGERPALSGDLGSDYEEPVSGGGAKPKEFAPPSEVRDVYLRGINQLRERLTYTADELNIEATMARVRFRSEAIAKSHRHSSLFDRNRFQIAGIQQPGDILALVTGRSITGLSDLVQSASQNQLAQLSAVAEITPYDVPIVKGPHRLVLTLFDGTLDDGSSLRSHGLTELESRGVQLKRYGNTLDAFTATSLPPDASLRLMPWMRGIRPVVRLRSPGMLGPQPVHPMSFGLASQTFPLPIVGVVDSGIDTSIVDLRRLVVAHESHIPVEYEDQSHGTLVGALAATGGGFTHDPEFFPLPLARLVDVQVFGSGSFGLIDEDDLLVQVEDAVKRYGPRATDPLDEPVLIWNLSVSQENAASEDAFSLIAMELDRVAKENDVIFTVAAGNYTEPPLRGWIPKLGPDRVARGIDRISPPADAALSVSVGSISDTSNPPTASPAEHPSPFSRCGPGPGMLVKPDVVHYGGTCGRYGEQVQGIRGPHRNGTPLEEIGTSFAAPRVAAQLANLAGVLPNPEPDLLKLLLLLSCTSPGDHDNSKRESVNYYGFGVPDSPAALLSCEPWSCLVLLRGEMRPGMSLTTPFPFPFALVEEKRRRGFVRMGLVYTPYLDSSKGAEYCQTNVSASLGRVFDYPKGDSRSYKREIPSIPQRDQNSAQYEKDLIEHGWKWSPAKLYERTFRRMQIHPLEQGWRLSTQLLLRRELEDYSEDVRQAFWIGIIVADPERKSPVYQEMRQQIQAMALAQPVVLRPRIPA